MKSIHVLRAIHSVAGLFKKIAREMEKSSFNSLVPFFMGNYDFVIIIIELYLVVRGRNRIDIKICAINPLKTQRGCSFRK